MNIPFCTSVPDYEGNPQKIIFTISSLALTAHDEIRRLYLIEALCGEITRAVYDRASVSTHLQTTRQEVAQIKRYLDAVLFDLLEIGQPA